jgi:hypothetical protein
MLTFDFKNQLLGPWDTAKGHLIAGLDRLYAGLRDTDVFAQTLSTDNTTGALTSTQLAALQDQINAGTASQALLCCRPDVKSLAEHLPIIRWHIKTGPLITSCRIWCGIMDTIPSAGSDTQAGQDGILFRYSTVAGDPGWMGFASKSLGGNAFSITSGPVATILPDTVYDLQIRVESVTSATQARVGFSVNRGPELFLTANVPIIAQYVGFGMSPVLEVETRVAATRSVFVSRAYFEAN